MRLSLQDDVVLTSSGAAYTSVNSCECRHERGGVYGAQQPLRTKSDAQRAWRESNKKTHQTNLQTARISQDGATSVVGISEMFHSPTVTTRAVD